MAVIARGGDPADASGCAARGHDFLGDFGPARLAGAGGMVGLAPSLPVAAEPTLCQLEDQAGKIERAGGHDGVQLFPLFAHAPHGSIARPSRRTAV